MAKPNGFWPLGFPLSRSFYVKLCLQPITPEWDTVRCELVQVQLAAQRSAAASHPGDWLIPGFSRPTAEKEGRAGGGSTWVRSYVGGPKTSARPPV
jgi:hypothetical protein